MSRISSGLLRLILAVGLPVIVSSIVYFSTLAPGVVGLDSAELVTGAYTLGIVHPTGYPIYLLIGKLFTMLPVGIIAFRMNLLSAVLGILSAAVLARLIHRETGSVLAAWVGSLFLIIANTFWSMAVVAEVYTLHTLFTGLTLLLLLSWRASPGRRGIFAIGLIFGLSLTNHVTSLFTLPLIVWVVVKRLGWRAALKASPVAMIAGLIGLTPYLYFPLRYAANPALNYVRTYYDVDLGTLRGIWWMVSGEAYRFFAFGYDPAHYLGELKGVFQLFIENFTMAGILIGALGMASLWLKDRALAFPLIGVFGINVLFFAGYAVVDKATMFLPALYYFSFFIGFGFQACRDLIHKVEFLSQGERRLASQVLTASLMVVIAITGWVHWGWSDKSEVYGPEIYARRVLSSVPDNAIIIGKWSTAVILEYFQHVEGERPDLVIFNRSRYEVASYYNHWKDGETYEDAVSMILETEEDLLQILGRDRVIFDAEYDPYFARMYEYRPVGNLFELIPRSEVLSDS